MKMTRKYTHVESDTFVFDEQDILDALLAKHNLRPYETNRKFRFEIYEPDDSGKHVAELIIEYATPIEA